MDSAGGSLVPLPPEHESSSDKGEFPLDEDQSPSDGGALLDRGCAHISYDLKTAEYVFHVLEAGDPAWGWVKSLLSTKVDRSIRLHPNSLTQESP